MAVVVMMTFVCVFDSSGNLFDWILFVDSRFMIGGMVVIGMSLNFCSVCRAIIAAADIVFVWCGFLYSKKNCWCLIRSCQWPSSNFSIFKVTHLRVMP